MNAIIAAFVIHCSFGMAQEGEKATTLLKTVEEVTNATMKGEYAKVIDRTYGKVVEAMGGREKAI